MHSMNDDAITKCPKCKTQNLIEVCVTEENQLFEYCMECNYKKQIREEE